MPDPKAVTKEIPDSALEPELDANGAEVGWCVRYFGKKPFHGTYADGTDFDLKAGDVIPVAFAGGGFLPRKAGGAA